MKNFNKVKAYNDYFKVCRIIESCNTEEQLSVAFNVYKRFRQQLPVGVGLRGELLAPLREKLDHKRKYLFLSENFFPKRY